MIGRCFSLRLPTKATKRQDRRARGHSSWCRERVPLQEGFPAYWTVDRHVYRQQWRHILGRPSTYMCL